MHLRSRSASYRSVATATTLLLLVIVLALPVGAFGAPSSGPPPPPTSRSPQALGPANPCPTAACALPSISHPQLPLETWYNVSSYQRFSPPSLVGASMAYDASDNYLVLFGGCAPTACPAAAQTWTYSGGSWTNVTGLGPQPPARAYASLVFDSHDLYLVLFGGLGVGSAALNDTWSFTGGVWTNATNVSNAPQARYAASMIFDPTVNSVVLFGGCGPTGCPRNDTWRFQSGVWRNASTSAGSAPSGRYGASFTWDTGDGYGVLFGGGNATGPLGDTWQWSRGRWAKLNVTGAPPARDFASFTYDTIRNLTYLVGGNGSSGLISDVWKFTNGHWSNQTGAGGPGPSARFGMAVPESTIAVLASGQRRWDYSFFFGGSSGRCLTCGNRSLGDSWVYEQQLSVSSTALPTVTEVGQPISFGSTAGGGSSPYVYLWQFGDGTTSFSENPVHSYHWSTTFSAQVSVSDSAGVETDASILITVVSGPLVSVSVQPSATDTGRPFSFVGTVSGGTGPYSYRWSFGDFATATTIDTSHDYAALGHFPVNLTATDTVQGFGVAFANVTVNALPELTAAASTLSPEVGSNVSYTASVVGGTAPFVFAWDFGDGNTSGGATTVHRYSAPGTYLVGASVADAVGAVRWENLSVVVGAISRPPPQHPATNPFGLTNDQLVGAILLGAGAVLAVVVAIVLLVHRRRRAPPSLAAAPVGQAGWDSEEESGSPANSRTARRSINRFYRRRS